MGNHAGDVGIGAPMLPLPISEVASKSPFEFGSVAGSAAFQIKVIDLIRIGMKSSKRQGRER